MPNAPLPDKGFTSTNGISSDGSPINFTTGLSIPIIKSKALDSLKTLTAIMADLVAIIMAVTLARVMFLKF